jgi:8-oxo-dGTP pyrophosphatase MutT (NUDIX family)
MTELPIVPLSRLSLTFAPKPWAFAHERRAEIDAYFAGLREKKPKLYNGRVLLMRDSTLSDDVLRGACFDTDYASFLAWRDWGFPDPMVRNCFAMGALRTADDAFLLGVMGPHTANAGRTYFPAGTPDPNDVRGDNTVDLEGSVTRELGEETGLTPDDYSMQPGWMLVPAGPRYALFKLLQAHETAEVLRRRVLDYLAAEEDPELSGVHIVRSPADLNSEIPPFTDAFIRHMWR